MNVAKVMAEAVGAHRSGKLDEAAQTYRQVLNVDPREFDALNNLGIILAQKGDLSTASDLLARALEVRPDSPDSRSNLANLYVQLGRMDEAAACYRKALEKNPDHVDALHNLGLFFEKQNRHEEAAYYWERQYELNSKSPEAILGLARNRKARGLMNAATELFWQAGVVHLNRGNWAEALVSCTEAVALEPEIARNQCGVGIALLMLGQRQEALQRYQRATELAPGDPSIHSRFAYAFSQLSMWSEAAACYRYVLKIEPYDGKTKCNLGKALMQLGEREEAIKWIDDALHNDAGLLEARLARSQYLLESGDFERGWKDYEFRWLWPRDIRPRYDRPMWDGSPLNGRSILMVPEQGMGDTIHFVRYASLLKQAGAGEVILAVPPTLNLLATCPGVDRIVDINGAVPKSDLIVPILSLPRLFQTTLATIPATVPYVTPDPAWVEYWKQKLSGVDALKVGIVWKGSPGLWADSRRSVTLQQFTPIAEVRGVEFFSLQKDIDPVPPWKQPFALADLGPELDSFGETAAVMKNLDLVITVDTAAAHLAGALGVPVWVALRFVSDWRWLRDREDSLWYPSMRLFRQKTRDDWSDVFLRIRAELAAHSFRRHQGSVPVPSAVDRIVEKNVADSDKLSESADPSALRAVGDAYVKLQQFDNAIASYQRILAGNPEDGDTLNNLGVALMRQGRREEAIATYEQALRINPNHSRTHNNLGVELNDMGRFEEAFAHFEHAIALESNYAGAHLNRAMSWLMAGDLERGLPEYEWRCKLEEYRQPAFVQPRWDGSNSEGKTIYLHVEQGFGDTIQCVRYAKYLKRAGSITFIGGSPELGSLLATCPGIDRVVPLNGPMPPFDAFIPVMSLPALFGTTLQTIPAEIPYLFPDEARVESWRREFESVREAKIGIAWQGSRLHRTDRTRSIPIEKLVPLAAVPRVRLFSLQKDAVGRPPFAMTDLSGKLGTFLDTAAAMKNLDLVITADTAVAHLAGALGVPVWVALPFVPDWRWMLHREDSPWYPSMWLVRQTRIGVWDDVFERMSAELVKFARNLA